MTGYLICAAVSVIALLVLMVPPSHRHMTWWQWHRYVTTRRTPITPKDIPRSVPPGWLLIGLAMIATGCGGGAVLSTQAHSTAGPVVFWGLVVPLLLLGAHGVTCGAVAWRLRTTIPPHPRR
jgi:hypothetical protein